MFWFLWTAVAWASPMMSATLAADGHYTLRVIPDRSWVEAEVSVAGGETADLGPAEVDVPVVIEGWTVDQGALRVKLTIAGKGGQGVTWLLEVDPFRVPARVPELHERKRMFGTKKRP